MTTKDARLHMAMKPEDNLALTLLRAQLEIKTNRRWTVSAVVREALRALAREQHITLQDAYTTPNA